MTPAAIAPANPAESHDGNAQPVAGVVPFVAAAHEHTEPAFTDTFTPGAAALIRGPSGPFNIPAFGYIRHIFLEVTAAGGVIGAGVLSADYPWNLFQSITLLDVNGAPIFGPLDGYATLWANIAGGYAYQQDPRRGPGFVATINASFVLRIPVEIYHHDALGSLANQNAAAAYQLQYIINPSTVLYSTAPTTVPTFTVKGWLEAWTLPNETDIAGRPQAQEPPAHGTSQYWSAANKPVIAGQNAILLNRVGNLIRNIIVIARNATGARDDTVMPDPITVQWDARVLHQVSQNYQRQVMFERIENLFARDAGVFIFSFDHSEEGRSGDGPPNLWIPTVQSTRLEVDGVAATAGNIQVITNDIAPVEVLPSERFVETSSTGFHPAVGAGPAR